MQIEIVEPIKNAEVFGKVIVICKLTPCSYIVNDWTLATACTPHKEPFRFLYSLSGREDLCETDFCEYRICIPQKDECIAVFEWDTTQHPDGPITLSLSANELVTSIELNILNHQVSYRLLNKKLINSNVEYLNDYTIELNVAEDVHELIESLPDGVLVDQEAGIHERFTLPTNAIILGEQLVERVLNLQDAALKKIGDTIYITVLPETAKYFNKEFANTRPRIQLGQIGSSSILEREISTIDPIEFPATHADVFEGE